MSSDAEELYLKNYTSYGVVAYDEVEYPEEDYDPYLEGEQLWEAYNER